MWWTVCVILSLPWLALPGKADSPFFVETPQNVSAAIGRDAHLNCSVMGAGAYKVAWVGLARGTVLSLHDEKVYDHPRVEIRHSSSSAGLDSFILTIKDITNEDKGQFLCQVNTVQALRRLYTLSIVVPPTIKDASSSGDIELSEGESAVLTCRAEGTPTPTITWRREDSSQIKTHTLHPTADGELSLRNVDRTNSGAYLCIATNGIPPSVSKRIQLNVKFQPKIKATAVFVEAQIGGDANLSCLVDAYPKPEMTWLQDVTRTSMRNHLFLHTHEDGRIIERNQIQSSVVRIHDSQFLMTLLIKDSQPGDFHGYRCYVNNSEGSAEDRITLKEKITTTPPATTTASTRAATMTSQNPTFFIHRVTSPRSFVDWKPGIENSMNRTFHNDFYVTTPSPQQLFFSDQHKHNSNSQKRKNQSKHLSSSEDIRNEMDLNAFSNAGRDEQTWLGLSVISSSILLIFNRKLP